MHSFLNPLFGIYIHWPYCLSKCPYCDFYSCVNKKINEKEILKYYQRDILFFCRLKKNFLPVSSLFFGGGTPSLMSEELLESIILFLKRHFEFAQSVEITLEANPEAITFEKMRNFREIGINRLSVGIQAMNESDLHILGRCHTVETALSCLLEAKKIFQEVNADFIYARPNQTFNAWCYELKQILALDLTHYSLYQLTVEENTPFYQHRITVPDEEKSRKFYLMTNEIMKKAHCPPYEISNYAKNGHECRHNLTYWRGYDYLGIGPAAHGRIGLTATQNPRSVSEWMQKDPLCVSLTCSEKREEQILMGLRLLQEGFPVSLLNPKGVEKAIRYQWGFVRDHFFYVNEEGALLLNQLILEVLPMES